MAFDNKGPREKRPGVKIDNKNSTVSPAKVPTSIAFEKKADEAFAKVEDYKQRMWDLSAKYKILIEDRILPINKTLITKDFEGEVLNKLITLASEMNDDGTQPESLGATALCMLLMKMNLVQRDMINELAYKVDKLERNVSVPKNSENK